MHIFKRTALQVLPVAVAMMADSCIDPRNVAEANPGREHPSLRVSVKDLDLTSHAGAVTAYLRIRNAARSVCGSPDSIFPQEKAAWERCVDEAISSAVARLGNARLTDYTLTRTRRPHVIRTAEISTEHAR